jgi:hypothetical protein
VRKPETKEVFKYLGVPLIFLTVALMGGMRLAIENSDLRFIAPQLITLILAAFALILFVRGGLVELSERIGERLGLIENLSGTIFLLSLYFATAQVFNLVTPERGLMNFCFNLFYFLIFFNNLFVVFNPRRLVKSLAIVLGASFAVKYLLLADLFAPTESWSKYILQKLLQTASLGALEFEMFAPATGYLAFATLVLYIIGLYAIAPRTQASEELLYKIFMERYKLRPAERKQLIAAIAEATSKEEDEIIEAEIVEESLAETRGLK